MIAKYKIGTTIWTKEIIKHYRTEEWKSRYDIKCNWCQHIVSTDAVKRNLTRWCWFCRSRFYIWYSQWAKIVIGFDTKSNPIFKCNICNNESSYEWQCSCTHKINYVWMVITWRVLISMYRKKSSHGKSTYGKYVFKCLTCWRKTNNSPSNIHTSKCICSYRDTKYNIWDIIFNRMVVWRTASYIIMKCKTCNKVATMSSSYLHWCQCDYHWNRKRILDY